MDGGGEGERVLFCQRFDGLIVEGLALLQQFVDQAPKLVELVQIQGFVEEFRELSFEVGIELIEGSLIGDLVDFFSG